MKGKKLARIYSEQAMLEDAKARGFKVVPVVSNIRESGRVNDYVDMIKYIIVGENTVGIVTKKGEVEELCTPYHSVKRRLKAWRFDDEVNTSSCKLTSHRYKTNLRFLGGKIFFAKLVGIAFDIVDHDGQTRETYNGLEANHKDCSGGLEWYADDNRENIEIVDKTRNTRAGQASKKLLKEGLWISFSADDKDFVDYVLDKNFSKNEFEKIYDVRKFKKGRTITCEFIKGQGVKTMECLVK